MRLGQLARKLSLRPGQIIEFLATNHIQVEENSNLRLEERHVELIVEYFAPESLAEIRAEADEVEETVAAVINPVLESKESEITTQLPDEEIQSSDDSLPEVIRVQKVELSGLKVLGKIDLPEPKKKEPVVEQNTEGEAIPVEKPVLNKALDKRKPKQDRRDRTHQRDRKNPLQLQREREAREEEEKKRVEAEREKERRKRHYEEKRKSVVQPKRMKQAKQQPVSTKRVDTRPVPKTWFGKFLRWWTT